MCLQVFICFEPMTEVGCFISTDNLQILGEPDLDVQYLASINKLLLDISVELLPPYIIHRLAKEYQIIVNYRIDFQAISPVKYFTSQYADSKQLYKPNARLPYYHSIDCPDAGV